MSGITKKEIRHLAELARLEISEKDEIKLEHDLAEILNYFNELKELDVENTLPLTGGTSLLNATREDDLSFKSIDGGSDDTTKGRESFPEEEDGYLKVPSVF